MELPCVYQSRFSGSLQGLFINVNFCLVYIWKLDYINHSILSFPPVTFGWPQIFVSPYKIQRVTWKSRWHFGWKSKILKLKKSRFINYPIKCVEPSKFLPTMISTLIFVLFSLISNGFAEPLGAFSRHQPTFSTQLNWEKLPLGLHTRVRPNNISKCYLRQGKLAAQLHSFLFIRR